MTTTFFGKALFVETDYNFINKILADGDLLQKFPLTICRTVLEGLNLARKANLNVRIIYVSQSLIDQDTFNQIKEFMTVRPEIPIVLIKSEDGAIQVKGKELLGNFEKVLFSPKNYKDFVDYCVSLFEAKNDWNENRASENAKFEEFENDEKKFVAVGLKDFVLSPKSFFNLHIKLSNNRFIKIINAGDEVTAEFIQKYNDKGVKDLYIPEDEHNKYLAFTGKITDRIVSNSSASQDVKVRTTLKLGKNVVQNLNQLGINPQKLDHADLFLGQSIHIIRSMRMKSQTLKNFLDMLDTNEHTSTVAFMAALISNEMGYESTKSIKQIGLGALLHDIGLFDLKPELEEADPDSLNEDDLKLYEKHAYHGAVMLRELNTFDEGTCLMVEHHHLRRKGDINSKRSTNVNTATEIVSVADDFFNMVIQGGHSPEKLEFFMNFSLKNFSPNIEKAMQKLLNIGKNKR